MFDVVAAYFGASQIKAVLKGASITTVVTQTLKEIPKDAIKIVTSTKKITINTAEEITKKVKKEGTEIIIEKIKYTPVEFRGKIYTKPDTSRINLANGTTDFTPLNKSGNPVQAGWKHISDGHFNREIANSRSVFTKSEEKIKILLQQKSVINTTLIEVQPGIYKRTANLNEIIGKTALKFGGKETSWVEIFTDVKGNIITTYPVPAP